MTFTWLQWCAPELAREGLLTNENWVERNAAEAVAMFGNQGLHTAATIMGSIHPRGIDYIRQAPVLVLAGSNGSSLSKKKDRIFLAGQWSRLMTEGPRLKEVLAHFGLKPQHRKITAGVLAPTRWATVAALSALDPSTLAQAIPEKKQGNWIVALSAWRSRMGSRYHDHRKHFAWAALAFSRTDMVFDPGDLADFAGSPAVHFDTRWTLEQARAASTRWHVELQRMTSEEKFYQEHGIGFSDPIDYGALPVAAEHNGYDIVAVQSGADLYAEGISMHHCVASYTREVVTGKSRIFSVRRGEKRFATFELNPATSGWSMRQLKGPCNAVPPPPVETAVRSFLKSLKDAA